MIVEYYYSLFFSTTLTIEELIKLHYWTSYFVILFLHSFNFSYLGPLSYFCISTLIYFIWIHHLVLELSWVWESLWILAIAKVTCRVLISFFASIMASNTHSSIPILEFDGSDYGYWSIKIQTFLIGKYFLDIIDDGYIYSTNWKTLLVDDKKVKKECRSKNSLSLSHL